MEVQETGWKSRGLAESLEISSGKHDVAIPTGTHKNHVYQVMIQACKSVEWLRWIS